MTKAKTGWLLLGILFLGSFAVAQETAREKYHKAGIEAYQQGQYSEAEKQFPAMVKQAEQFLAMLKEAPRFATMLNNLVEIYLSLAN